MPNQDPEPQQDSFEPEEDFPPEETHTDDPLGDALYDTDSGRVEPEAPFDEEDLMEQPPEVADDTKPTDATLHEEED